MCTASWFHDTSCKKSYDWCKISRCCDMIGERFILIDVRYRDTYPYAAIWLAWDTYPKTQGSDWCEQHTTPLPNIELFLFYEKKKLKTIELMMLMLHYTKHHLIQTLPPSSSPFEDRNLILPMLINALKVMMNSWGNIPLVGQKVLRLLWSKIKRQWFWFGWSGSSH